MPELLPTALALLAVALMATALVEMTVGNFMLAGLSFLGASILLYLRETRRGDDESEAE